MKKMITSVVPVVVLFAFVMAQANGQLKIDKKPPGDLTTPVKGPNAGDSVQNNKALLNGLMITQFGAVRNGAKIDVTGVVSNIAPRAIPITYKISTLTGTTWTKLRTSGTIFVRAKGKTDVSEELPATNDVLRLRLEVNGGPNDSAVKDFTLAAKKTVFVVRYTTSLNWVLAREYDNDLSDGFDASQLARTELQPLGFQTQIKKTKTTGFDTPFSISTNIHTWLSVRTTGSQVRTFGTKAEAVKFRNSLISLVQDRGLTVEDPREQ
jgi:hypothetical protein